MSKIQMSDYDSEFARDDLNQMLYFRQIFDNYSVADHFKILFSIMELVDNGELLVKDISVSNKNPFYDQLTICRIPLYGMIYLKEIDFFITLLDNLILNRITFSQFCQEYSKKDELITTEVEENEVVYLKADFAPSFRGATAHSLTNQIYKAICVTDFLDCEELQSESTEIFFGKYPFLKEYLVNVQKELKKLRD